MEQWSTCNGPDGHSFLCQTSHQFPQKSQFGKQTDFGYERRTAGAALPSLMSPQNNNSKNEASSVP